LVSNILRSKKLAVRVKAAPPVFIIIRVLTTSLSFLPSQYTSTKLASSPLKASEKSGQIDTNPDLKSANSNVLQKSSRGLRYFC
jgi:hypothetical protein